MKKLISAALIAAMLSLYGCSREKSYSSADRTVYTAPDISFSLNNDYAVQEEDGYEGTSYRIDGTVFDRIVLNEKENNLTADGFIDSYTELFSERSDIAEDFEAEKPEGFPFDVAGVHVKYKDTDRKRSGYSVYYIIKDGISVNIYADYNAKERELARSYLYDIISSIEFTGGNVLPDSPQAMEGETFTVDYDPVWRGKYLPDEKNGTSSTAEFSLAIADSMSESGAYVKVGTEYDSAFDTASQAAEYMAEKFEGDREYADVVTETTELWGRQASKVSAVKNEGYNDQKDIHTFYYTDVNGLISSIEVFFAEKDAEKLSPETESLINGIKFRDLSDDEAARLKATPHKARLSALH